MRNPLVVYHAGCMDGVAAAWCFWRQHKEFEYYPGVYQKDMKLDLQLFADRNVYIVDFSYPLKETKQILVVCKSLTMLDHHESFFKMLELLGNHPKLNTYYCTNKNSGCIIAWDFLNPSRVPPKALLHIQDRDLWKFELPFTKEINAALFLEEYTDFEVFDAAICDLEQLIAVGSVLVLDQAKRTKKTARGAQEVDGIWSVNAPRDLVSEVGNLLCKIPLESGELPLYVDRWNVSKNILEHSLRSIGDSDVSIIAKKYGGGGHKNAAGYKEKFE